MLINFEVLQQSFYSMSRVKRSRSDIKFNFRHILTRKPTGVPSELKFSELALEKGVRPLLDCISSKILHGKFLSELKPVVLSDLLTLPKEMIYLRMVIIGNKLVHIRFIFCFFL